MKTVTRCLHAGILLGVCIMSFIQASDNHHLSLASAAQYIIDQIDTTLDDDTYDICMRALSGQSHDEREISYAAHAIYYALRDNQEHVYVPDVTDIISELKDVEQSREPRPEILQSQNIPPDESADSDEQQQSVNFAIGGGSLASNNRSSNGMNIATSGASAENDNMSAGVNIATNTGQSIAQDTSRGLNIALGKSTNNSS